MDQQQTQGQQKQGQDAPDESRQVPGSSQPGSSTERGSDRDTGGITNRDLDSEMEEQEELPDRGTSQSER